MPLIVLWDIDHTLIDNAGVSKEIYAAAFKALSGESPGEAAPTEGRTDRLIMREMFLRHDLPEPDWAYTESALTRAGQDRLDDLRRRGHVLPGVREILELSSLHSGWVSSVLTGNIAANAEVKLSAFGLDALLDLAVGAFGADALQRHELVGIARSRVQRRYGLPDSVPVVLVGDTPRDVEAALASGVEAIAVATGIHSRTELSAAGASVVLPDLSDAHDVLRLLEAFAIQR